ncbi:hypothetical protein KCP70_21935 [Salmonella enterica subsp. enterica]|nr:hypothetical protein KCP70_21935 [Salmonella enterica subsp. enterica]
MTLARRSISAARATGAAATYCRSLAHSPANNVFHWRSAYPVTLPPPSLCRRPLKAGCSQLGSRLGGERA